jgi:hypothetical protein
MVAVRREVRSRKGSLKYVGTKFVEEKSGPAVYWDQNSKLQGELSRGLWEGYNQGFFEPTSDPEMEGFLEQLKLNRQTYCYKS